MPISESQAAELQKRIMATDLSLTVSEGDNDVQKLCRGLLEQQLFILQLIAEMNGIDPSTKAARDSIGLPPEQVRPPIR